MCNNIDILETKILVDYPDVLETLLKDHTTEQNIFWATNDYETLGEGYGYKSQIKPELITGKNDKVIMPRVLKDKERQTARVRKMAEVFTPSWICNTQNNMIDESWFGRKDVFNSEITDADGKHSWRVNPEKITFPEGKTWRDYVRDTRLEITCGEAPYLVSRYDTTTGESIALERRIGLLDRKMRVVSENTEDSGDWLDAAQDAYKNIYGFEWQGDNLLLAREAMLFSFIEYYKAKFGKEPQKKSINFIAYIISWNLWQMDGLKGVVPMSCHEEITTEDNLFDISGKTVTPCPGCQKNELKSHNGIYCLIKDWQLKAPESGRMGKRIKFIDLMK